MVFHDQISRTAFRIISDQYGFEGYAIDNPTLVDHLKKKVYRVRILFRAYGTQYLDPDDTVVGEMLFDASSGNIIKITPRRKVWDNTDKLLTNLGKAIDIIRSRRQPDF